MSRYATCQLTARDFVVLQNLVSSQRLGAARLQEQMCEKLASAVVLAPAEIPAQIVTLDSRVRFRREGRLAETRVVSVSDDSHPLGAALSVTTPLGLALLGRRPGDKVTVQDLHGEDTRAEVIAVIYQPEAAERRLRPA
ncbi:GreA/GreB family elongation factor [Pelagibius sp. CAU 1746]|uniref:GreA/GreB family elongation factor n=1 Tax=Pelagibius sp. CAU 1746 TaxID=3140370 RepID=UPI00325B5694